MLATMICQVCEWMNEPDDTPTPCWTVGDRVRVGTGKTVWRIVEFWNGTDGQPLAQLHAESGYARTSATLDRLERA